MSGIETNPSALSDQQLVYACRLMPWERRLSDWVWSGTGCTGALLAAAVFVVSFHLLVRVFVSAGNAHLILLVPLGIVLGATLLLSIDRVAERRRRVYWSELERRYAGATIREYIGQVEAESDPAPQTCVIVSGSALPHGGNWLVRVRLWDGQRGAVESRTIHPAYLSGPEAKDVELSSGQVMLTSEECETVRRAAAEGAGLDKDVSFRSMVIDGAPAQLVVWERGRGVVRTCSCNLCGVPHDKEGHPAMRLMRLVMELSRKVETKPLIVGACDSATGDITISSV